MKKPTPEDFSLSQAQVNRYLRANMGLRYGYISAVSFTGLCVFVGILAKGFVGFVLGILIGIIAAIFIIVFGGSMGEQIHALFFSSFDRFLEYRNAIKKYDLVKKHNSDSL